MLNIQIKTVPHESQRYSTCGDYFYKDGVLQIVISEQINKDYEYLILLHELVEIILTEHRGIMEEDISKFDMEHPELENPGDDLRACYHKEHMTASAVEEYICDELGYEWKKYNDNIE